MDLGGQNRKLIANSERVEGNEARQTLEALTAIHKEGNSVASLKKRP